MTVSARGGICEKCGSPGARGEHLLMSNPPQQPYTCTNGECGHYWTESFGGVDYRSMPSMPGEVTWAVPDYVKRAAERDEEKHALHVRFMEKQLATMDAEAAYRAVLQEHHIRQTEALEGILQFLRVSREEDLNRSRVVMD